MTNEQFDNLCKMIESDNFDDILLAIEIIREQFWSDINDKDFRVPKRYRIVLDYLQTRCALSPSLTGNTYQGKLKFVCSSDFENYRKTFDIITELNKARYVRNSIKKP